MSENPSRRSADWPPPNERGARGPQPGYEGQRREPAAWEPQPRATPRGARPDDQRGASRDDRTRRGGGPAPAPWEAARDAGYDDRGAARGGSGGVSGRGSRRGGGDGYGGYDDPYADDSGARSSGRGAGRDDYQRGAAPSGGRRAAAPSEAAPYDDYDGADGGSSRGAGGRRGQAGGGATRSGRGAAAATMPLGTKAGTAFLCAAGTALVLAFLSATASSGGGARSIAGISLNSKLIMSTILALPVGAAVIGGLLKWRRIEPLGLTWGYGAVAGLSWLSLLFMAQVKNVIPHLPPFLTVPLLAGAAFAAGAALTDDSTTVTGRYACLAAVIASHIGIVAIVVTIVLA